MAKENAEWTDAYLEMALICSMKARLSGYYIRDSKQSNALIKIEDKIRKLINKIREEY